MPQNYVPIFIFIAFVGILIPVTLLAAKLVRPDNPSKSKFQAGAPRQPQQEQIDAL